MTSGIVFDIKEFAIHDGPGIRTTVFLKGCPLACMWCHNPEGQSSQPRVICSPAGERVAGRVYTPPELAGILNQQAHILKANEGGVTFSGGEPLRQVDFILEVINLLDDLHILLDTSGYGEAEDFNRVVKQCDLVFFDLKLIDNALHRHFTGCDNTPILQNLHALSRMGVPFVVRVPLVPGITDTNENLAGIAREIRGMPNLQRVDLLPYNKAAGSKYRSAGMEFKPEYDERAELNINTTAFERDGIKVEVA